MTAHDRRWWEVPLQHQREGHQGRIALVQGRDARIPCPKCGAYPVVYNGNYFCDNWSYPAGAGECDWALAHPARSVRDREFCDLVGTDYS